VQERPRQGHHEGRHGLRLRAGVMTRSFHALHLHALHPVMGVPAIALVLCALAGRGAADGGKQLKVCGDPSNLPFSNEKLQGIENKIADVIAKDMGLTVAYTWWPHQRGVVKRALNTLRCDVMLGIPKGYDAVLWTKPY